MAPKPSHSFIQKYKDCPLSCYLSYEIGLKAKEDVKSQHHLAYGSAGHESLAILYKEGFGAIQKAKEAFDKAYPYQLDEEDMAKTREHWPIVLDAYVKQYADDQKKWKIISTEEREEFDYAEDNGFVVKLDLVVENIEFGGIYGVDHKIVGGSKAYLSQDYWLGFDPNSQVTKYTAFIKQKYGDCSGFIINAIGMGNRSRAYKGEPAGFWHRFGRQMFNRNDTQLEIEQRDTRYWMDRIEESRRTNSWGMNTQGCRWCEFRPICGAGWTWPEDRELIEIQYDARRPK